MLFGDLGQRSIVSCLSIFSKDFSSETARQISIQFLIQPPGKGGKKVCVLDPGHMTKVATLPIYG